MGRLRDFCLSERRVLKTTWKLRLTVVLCAALFAGLTGEFWLAAIAESVIHAESPIPSDLILVEDFDHNYWLYGQAAELTTQNVSTRIVVPVLRRASGAGPAVARTLAETAGIEELEILEVDEIEPIALNTARQTADLLDTDKLRSITVIASRYRSRRTYWVYSGVFEARGVKVYCVPVADPTRPEPWWVTWHGMQEVMLEFLKLQYYRLFVL